MISRPDIVAGCRLQWSDTYLTTQEKSA